MESAIELVKRVHVAEDKVKALQADRDRRRDEHVAHVRHLEYEMYGPIIRNLETRMRSVLQEADEKQEKLQGEITRQITDNMAVVNQVKRIFDLLRVPSRTLREINETAITYCGQRWQTDSFKEALPYLYQGSRLNIRLFIVENRKPKNKYSLCALGDTVFPEDMLPLEHSYGCAFNTDGPYRLIAVIRDGASVAELKAYADRKRAEILVRLKGNYDELLAEYEDAQAYRPDDFLSLLVSQCDGCGYFKTILDADWERKNGTCARCQSQMRDVL